MDRRAIWPDFRDAWVVHDDGVLLVVDKPAGVASQAADPSQPDDLVTRLRAHLGGAYLGVHQRLDKDTSGLLVFTRKREANAGLAAQFERRAVAKTYIACVTGWPRGRDQTTLRDGLAAGPGGTMRVVPAPRSQGGGERGAKLAVTHVKVLARRGDRAMLELSLETGRTHQARAQLAHAGAPIGGDVLYGGSPAPRLLLHASALSLEHPGSGRAVRFTSPPPAAFPSWLDHGDLAEGVYDDDGALGRALEQALERRWGLGRGGATTAFRLANEAGDGLPRLAVDAYDGWLVAQLHGDDEGPWANRDRRERVLDRLGTLGFDGVYLKLRPKQASTVVDSRRAELAPADPVRGMAAPAEFAILEHGVPLLVRLGDGLSTGLFLDQRANRRRVREMAPGLRVANLFAYTCGFTVFAAVGGAAHTVSVDASVTALERGRANLDHAGIRGGEHTFIAEDVFAWLAHAARRAERFDLIVLDPPSYSTTKRGRFVADSDYAGLAAQALALLTPRGRLLACTNHRGISPGRFRRVLFEGARAAGRELAQVKDLPEPSDYPRASGGEPHMKSALVTLA